MTTKEEKWQEKYELAKKYYEHYHDLEIPSNFKTKNGYTKDPNGIALGSWIKLQRQAYQNNHQLKEEQIEKLKNIGMRFEQSNKKKTWDQKYNLVKAYYEHYQTLKIPTNFKTLDGYTKDEKGVPIGSWLSVQRRLIKEPNTIKITQEQKRKLQELGLETTPYHVLQDLKWEAKYELAKKYYEHYHDLEIPINFKTKDGYTKDSDGVELGIWIANQRQQYQQNKNYQQDRFMRLKQIGMRFEVNNKQKAWDQKYKLAKAYYEHYGHLNVPVYFKTKNGYKKDENGINLGAFINGQRKAYQGKETYHLTEEKIAKLKKIGMNFQIIDRKEEWNKKYNLAKSYYEHYGHVNIPYDFKTINGYDYQEDGIALGSWIKTQRQAYHHKHYLTKDRIEKLQQINMRFEIKHQKESWQEKYDLAKIYYKHHGHLEVPLSFKTTNGYEKDEDGIALGNWIRTQRQTYHHKTQSSLTKEQIEKLKNIGMRFEIKNKKEAWDQKYTLAKAYHDHHGNSNIPYDFKTKNGYEEDVNGIALGTWMAAQRQAYQEPSKLNKERKEKLEQLGIAFTIKTNKMTWDDKYQLAKNYYHYHGNLEIPITFKTKNGYLEDEEGIALGTWLWKQRQAYQGKSKRRSLTDERLEKLQQIDMNWFLQKNKDKHLQQEVIDSSNHQRKQIEILNRLKSYLLNYDGKTLPTKEQMNQDIIDYLNHKQTRH